MAKIFKALEKEHKKFKSIIEELSATTSKAQKKRKNLLISLKEGLQAHEEVEETYIYPTLLHKNKTKSLTLEGFEEHRLADHLLERLEETSFDDETWKAKLKVLQESLEHHIEEEESKLFPDALKILNKTELEKMDEGLNKLKLS